jgi:hypothetical protein
MERTITNIIPRAALDFCRGRQDSASGLIPPSPAKGSLRTSKKKIFLHHQLFTFHPVQLCSFHPVFATDIPAYIVQFIPD